MAATAVPARPPSVPDTTTVTHARRSRAWWLVRRPRAALALARSQPTWAAVRALAILPAPVRSAVGHGLTLAAGSAARTPSDHALAGPLHVVGLGLLGQRVDAERLAGRYGRDASPETRLRLARMALAIDAPRAAEALMPRTGGPGEPPGAQTIRGLTAFRLGHYGEAVDDLEQALAARPGDAVARRALDRVRGELALLEPAWRPSLGPVRHPLTPVPGRVVHLLTNSLPYRSAGYGVRSQQIAQAQRALGLDPVMVTRAGFPGSDGRVARGDDDLIGGVTYRRLAPDLPPGHPLDDVAQRTAEGLEAIVRDLRPAVLHPTSNHVNAQVALAIGARAGIPVVYEVRGFLEETWRSELGADAAATERYQRTRAVETDCLRRADAVVTLSETMRAAILDRADLDPARVVVVPNAVDVERFVPGSGDLRLAAELGIDDDETVIGYISSLVPYEGIGFLIDAVARLRARGRAVRLLVVGDGSDRARLEAISRQHGLHRRAIARFTGQVSHDQVERYYRTIDLFVIPRTADRVSQLVTPLKPYEAMAMAKPIVASDVPALREVIDDGRTGRLVPPEDPATLAEVLDALLDDPLGRARLGQAARSWVRRERTWAHNGERYLDLYRRLGAT